MKEVLSVKNVRLSDQQTIQSGVPSKELMYKAAMGVYTSYQWHGEIGIFCGSGNNGGDGYALATILQANGYKPEIILVSNKFSEDGLYYFNKCKELFIPILYFSKELKKYDIYVDALLGTGFKGSLKPELLSVINYLNYTNKPIISIDINSGMNGDTGLFEVAVKSDLTVSIGCYKPGLLLNKAKDCIKKLVNVDIGLHLVEKPYQLIENQDVKEFFKPRSNLSNKGTYGYVGIMGGSENYPGAIRLANLGQAALRSGCGVAKLIVPDCIYELIFNNVLETTVAKMPSKDGKMLFDPEKIDLILQGLRVLGIGVGWGESVEYEKILEHILLNHSLILVIDADGLNTLAKIDLSILNNTKCKVVLTPHLKEFSRLTGHSVKEITENLIEYGCEFTNKYNVTLLLKGPTTIIFNEKEVYFVSTGNPGMATAGSGDVLTGIITGMLGYGYENIGLAVSVSAYINGFSGDLAANNYGEVGMISSDTVQMIPLAIKELTK